MKTIPFQHIDTGQHITRSKNCRWESDRCEPAERRQVCSNQIFPGQIHSDHDQSKRGNNHYMDKSNVGLH